MAADGNEGPPSVEIRRAKEGHQRRSFDCLGHDIWPKNIKTGSTSLLQIHPAQPQFTPFHKSTDSLSYSGPVHQLVPNVTSPTSQSGPVSITMVLSL
ncbi:hypothetical protein ERO13_D10G082850v2 [Gossypium hirsutum]|uniref:Uncharacterized protein n=3 Tax=Gossypium TaxID=3633 RepID=A0A5J5PNB4_GOSBA|nr:hypothetical protein ES319_D10G088900v1 [Gossypium barbadense]KAG4125189.1 hypothetical protein ERO13_D10G082850v2 [Gossypium hirsutum]TYG49441.1 hypothetical protein ES288_D10G094700v1 [Gossypium darwinii]TYH48854.1 hypothetical protein ES332_D10G096100v1 [Gossypium tomentosum]